MQAHRGDAKQALELAPTRLDPPRTSAYQRSRSPQVLSAAEVAQGVGAVLTQAEVPFMPAPTFPSLESALDLGRAHQSPHATVGCAEVPCSMINPLAFRRSRFVHDQVAKDLPDISPLAVLSSWELRLAELGVEPPSTLIHDFTRAINYRFFRLENTSPNDKSAVVGRGLAPKIVSGMRKLVSRIVKFDGSNPTCLQSFLCLLCSAMNALHLSVGAACTVVS